MSALVEISGAVGSVLFGAACVPMAWETWQRGRSVGTPAATVWTFVFATLLFGIYLAAKVGVAQVPTLVIFVEFACWSLALKYHYFPRTQ